MPDSAREFITDRWILVPLAAFGAAGGASTVSMDLAVVLVVVAVASLMISPVRQVPNDG